MTHNHFSDSHCVYTIIKVADTRLAKVVRTEYSAFKSLSKMSQEHAATAVITFAFFLSYKFAFFISYKLLYNQLALKWKNPLSLSNKINDRFKK